MILNQTFLNCFLYIYKFLSLIFLFLKPISILLIFLFPFWICVNVWGFLIIKSVGVFFFFKYKVKCSWFIHQRCIFIKSLIRTFHILHYPKNTIFLIFWWKEPCCCSSLQHKKTEHKMNVAVKYLIECVQTSTPFQRNHRSNTPDVSGCWKRLCKLNSVFYFLFLSYQSWAQSISHSINSMKRKSSFPFPSLLFTLSSSKIINSSEANGKSTS